MKAINKFLLDNDIRIAQNPCISPDFCLDWAELIEDIKKGCIVDYPLSELETKLGALSLISGPTGDHAWKLNLVEGAHPDGILKKGCFLPGGWYCPASYDNLIRIKNLILESDERSTVFPGTDANLSNKTLGIGARFTSLHWPGVFWAMKALGIGVTANQNSIPRELVYDVDKMLAGELDTVPFPFIGTDVPEGHQGQSVQGMSHGCILEGLKNGFHRSRIPWSFNADHQPIGGKYDSREDDLVSGCLFASYITFDLSPELSVTEVPKTAEQRANWVDTNVGEDVLSSLKLKLSTIGMEGDEDELFGLICYVWPSMVKMKARDLKYEWVREKAFSSEKGRKYLRELSIDELPGITTPMTTAIMLALCEIMEMPVDFIAPAFGFQKNMPYANNEELEQLISDQWQVCQEFGVSIGFHSGSGKSDLNYQTMGRVTEGNFEIKTSGRYTYEMGVALHASADENDQKLWDDWFVFTVDLAASGSFSSQQTEKEMARSFIEDAYSTLDKELPEDLFYDEKSCRAHLLNLPRDPNLMFWFEYNFLYVLAANGSSQKSALGDHSPAGYRQRERFYTISDEGRLNYCKRVASYMVFLAENTGLVSKDTCIKAKVALDGYGAYAEFVQSIGAE